MRSINQAVGQDQSQPHTLPYGSVWPVLCFFPLCFFLGLSQSLFSSFLRAGLLFFSPAEIPPRYWGNNVVARKVRGLRKPNLPQITLVSLTFASLSHFLALSSFFSPGPVRSIICSVIAYAGMHLWKTAQRNARRHMVCVISESILDYSCWFLYGFEKHIRCSHLLKSNNTFLTPWMHASDHFLIIIFFKNNKFNKQFFFY